MSLQNKNPYQLLGVPSDASTQDIKSAYRQIVRRIHPDVNPDNIGAATQFHHVTLAHDFLTDIERRSDYDRQSSRRKNDREFVVDTKMSKHTLRVLDEQQIIYMLVNIHAKNAQKSQETRQSRLNLTLVLDQSNSMKGARIEKVKIAAHQIIDNLSDNDIISVVTFNDRAETIIDATPVKDKPALKAKISLITPSGGTEILKGIQAGAQQCRQFYDTHFVNHMILLTDGHTFGDQDETLALADELGTTGIGISAMGLGHDWNDQFLDNLASRTGGSSIYIRSVNAVVKFLNERVRTLVNAFAERMTLSIATDADIVLDTVFRLAPSPQPLSADGGNVLLGSLQIDRPISVLMQFRLPTKLQLGQRTIARLAIYGDILNNPEPHHYIIEDKHITIQNDPVRDETPDEILDALSKLTLYRLQERAQEALEGGNASEATRRLENLATRLLEMGHAELAEQAKEEANRVRHTQELSERGRKTLKYQTRLLLLSDSDQLDDKEDTTEDMT
jgi:Ca-activated chloride channel family protein